MCGLLLGALLATTCASAYGLAIDPDAVDEAVVRHRLMLFKTKLVGQVMLLNPLDEFALIVLNARHRMLLHVPVGGEDVVTDELLRTSIALIEVDGSDERLDGVAVDVYRVVQCARHHDDIAL